MAFPGNCTGRIINVDASTGCTLTRASIRGMTPQDFEDQAMKEVGMDKIITQAQEAKVAGVVEKTLETLVYSRLAPIKKSLQTSNIGGSQSIILPYIYRRQKRNINANYWIATAGTATPGAGAGGIPASAWDLTVQKNVSPWATSLPAPERYFLKGKHIVVDWFKSDTKTAWSSQFKILDAVNADAGGIYKTKLTLEPCVSSATWAGYDAATKLPYQPTTGFCYVLSNSVSDYESWAWNEVAENTNSLLTFWLQTARETHEYNDEYLKALNAALLSGYFKDFRAMPLAEQKRIMHQKSVTSWLNSVFYGQAINEKQAVETYQQLPTVVDPLSPDCVLEYKSNALGIMPMLTACSRTTDKLGTALDFSQLAEIGYNLKRARQSGGASGVDTVDIMTDRWTANNLLKHYNSMMKTNYSVDVNVNQNKVDVLSFENQILAKYVKLELPPDLGGYTMAVFWDEYFDDRLSAHVAPVEGVAPAGDLANRGRSIWMLDWSDIMVGIAATSSVQRQTNVADNLYNTIIKPNVRHYQLASKTWTTIMEDPNRHAVLTNFGATIQA
jgi:hypothetical protein